MSLRKARQEFLKSGHISHSEFEDFVQRDPTKNKKYLYKMLSWVYKEGNQMRAVFTSIENFHRNIRKIVEKDIYKYPTFNEFAEISVDAENDRVSRKKRRKNSQDNRLYKEGVHVIVNSKDLYIAQPLTEDASNEMGKRTKWCVTSTISDNHFNQYYFQTPAA